MRVFLIHGMGRSRASMALLGRRLKRQGHDPSLFGYAVRRRSLSEISLDFERHVRRELEGASARGSVSSALEGPAYAIVGHSLGNVITRLALPDLPSGLRRFVMLAPPNRSPALARRLRSHPVFRLLTGDAGQRLADHEFFETLPVPQLPTLIIAGDRSPAWLPHRGASSDGIVAVRETRLDGMAHETIDASHSFIMNDARVIGRVADFLGPRGRG